MKRKYAKEYSNLKIQGPKLTVLCRRQVVTEIFFQLPNGKIWSPKSGS